MNGIGEERYNKSHEKTSKFLKSKYNCYFCNNSNKDELEIHHIDKNKKNNNIDNLLVLCKKCHIQIHKEQKKEIVNNYRISGISLTVECNTTSVKDWFDSKLPLKLIFGLKPDIANKFRKIYVKGFINIGACNYYIGLLYNNKLIGVLGFSNDNYCRFEGDLYMKADTTISSYEKSADLLLFLLQSKEVQKELENKFNRKIITIFTKVFTEYSEIQRYKKHGEILKKEPKKLGFDISYNFEIGKYTFKEAISLWKQKNLK